MGVQERKEREKAQRRTSILDAARQIIKEKPYDSIIMEDIANRLELSRATLYLYFKNKEEIYATLLTLGMRELQAGYDKALKNPSQDPMENLVKCAFEFFTFYMSNHHYFDLLVTNRDDLLRECRPEVRKEFEEAGGAVIKPIAQVYKSGMDSGKFQKQDPDKMAFLLRAVAIGIAVGFREGNLKFPEDILIMRDLVLHGLLGKKS
ncbi:MAG TPA: TetR/AcrR family transcriptional regulator [Leptospiraceae bacterium]|nr:TetR/AcrR family transcriptional regulator [Leptospirales bacterium]HMX57780.1 TetR/AcrR family transcriptional regulator [Leptospiraceae bacterium]HMY44411.1 TetR/AcrR family transcriptional regulator [Leptospiraceae bacterium]HNE22277.1 TetR/AcrR family transcriptional regulator [Leptospiraceae bacterium]HNJ04612.1 TetR/AcrR family transcriptional regulator [Leptospiraceae bacterium]